MQEARQKENKIIYAAIVLLSLVLVSFWLLSNMYARYTTQTEGSDSARVAKFNVTETGTATQRVKIDDAYPGFEKTYDVSVTNNSEVALDYVMEIKNKYENLPLQFQMLNNENDEITSKSETIAATDHEAHSYKLKINWQKNAESQNPDYAGKTDVIEITLKAVQKD